MASKEILKHNGNVVPEINDDATSLFGDCEVFSRAKVLKLLAALQRNSGHNWAGTHIACLGDSLTANTAMGYPAYVAEQTGATVYNLGIGGKAVWPNEPGAACDFRRRISTIPADVDAIIILGDTNSGAQSVYSIDECYTTDPTKWAGRGNLVIDALKRSFPTVPVILCSTWVGSRSSMKVQQVRYIPEAFRHFCNLYGCHYINLATESPLNLLYSQSVWGLTATDQTHCNHEAMPLFADVIIEHLRKFPPPKWKGWDTIAITGYTVTGEDGKETTVELTDGSTVEVEAGKTAPLVVAKTGDLSSQWTSDNEDVACVMGGVVYGMTPGTATITATTRNGNTASCVVTVTEQ